MFLASSYLLLDQMGHIQFDKAWLYQHLSLYR